MEVKYRLTVIKDGYCFCDDAGFQRADGTVTLLKGPHTILVDTGGPNDRDVLKSRLQEEGVCLEDVEYVVGTHGHSDHIGNLNLFPNATFIVSYDISQGDRYLANELAQGKPYNIDEYVSIVCTPGHTGSDVSVVVQNTEQYGTVVVAGMPGDLFESEADYLSASTDADAIAENPELRRLNQKKMLELADWIVPGHDKMFAVRKSKSYDQTE